ncbi:Phosphorylase b kinase gamma catalytic chain, skeletal muscle/heart isoform [Homalodisca vitripennis]|nr:Phosphorylase b kinase gamma catalytic chain, skeletal muscle/heart isoform [Homalodisca vitripennis]
MKKQYRCALREAKKHSNENFIEGSTNKCKAAWNVINKAQKRTTSCGKAPDISPDDFNSFFISSVEEISTKVSASVNSSLAYLENAGSLGLSACCEFSPVSTEDVHGWACGVIMYTLLVGCPPFWHRKQMVMLRNIMDGKYSFTSPEWSDITEEPKDLIRKLLVVNPAERLTVREALQHPFFQLVLWDQDIAPLKKSLGTSSRRLSRISQLAMELKASSFDARKKFHFAILVVRAMVRISRLRYTPEPLSVESSRGDPYKIKVLRKVIDACAFRVYGHWVKKGEGQNRAALFENTPKVELKNLYMSNLSP